MLVGKGIKQGFFSKILIISDMWYGRVRYGLFFEAIAQVELRQVIDNVRDGKTGSASWWKKWNEVRYQTVVRARAS